MNAPVLYIVVPVALGVILSIFNQNLQRNRMISVLAVILLALLGLTLPAGSAVELGTGHVKGVLQPVCSGPADHHH